jgi:hypothetical protein
MNAEDNGDFWINLGSDEVRNVGYWYFPHYIFVE